jgi:hypothetical protein
MGRSAEAAAGDAATGGTVEDYPWMGTCEGTIRTVWAQWTESGARQCWWLNRCTAMSGRCARAGNVVRQPSKGDVPDAGEWCLDVLGSIGGEHWVVGSTAANQHQTLVGITTRLCGDRGNPSE